MQGRTSVFPLPHFYSNHGLRFKIMLKYYRTIVFLNVLRSIYQNLYTKNYNFESKVQNML